MAAVGKPVSCLVAVCTVRWPWQGEWLFSTEKKLLGAKRDLKLSVTGSRVFALKFIPAAFAFYFSLAFSSSFWAVLSPCCVSR